jgi:hypothetical protein
MSLATHDTYQSKDGVGDEHKKEGVAEERSRRVRLHVGVCAREAGDYSRCDQRHDSPHHIDHKLLFQNNILKMKYAHANVKSNLYHKCPRDFVELLGDLDQVEEHLYESEHDG